ncbi:MAG: DUF4118 domain-containing protein [Anaerolineae bacterium]|nr:DUF4118 domain-containing protein [Anaerolineae bacterium]
MAHASNVRPQTTIPAFAGRWLWQFLLVLAVVALATFALFLLRSYLGDTNISLVYLLIVLFCAAATNLRVTLLCGVSSFLCYDFFLIPPIFDFVPSSPVKLLDPLTFLIVALVTGILAERSRQYAVELATYRQVDQFRATLLYLISHNLRTPVATIKAALTSLLTLQDTLPVQRDLLAAANRDCDRLNQLIGNVLQLSKLDSHALQLHQDWNGLDEVISTVFARWSDAVAHKQLTASIPPSLPLIRFDFTLIQEVLTNLIDNAFRHGCPPVHVSITLQPNEVWIAVEGAGTGIPESERATLFQPFTSGRAGGVGLGLAVCRGLVEAHRGRLWATFLPGKTRFTFSLPRIVYQDSGNESDADR